MANMRELRDRIKSVNSTKKITKAQELIATSQISKAQARVAAAQPFADQITAILADLANASSIQHRMLNEPEDAQRSAVLVVTSDRGMCGGYNHNVLKEASELIAYLEDQGREVDIYVLGNKGIVYYTFREIELAPARYLMIDGAGDPNTAPEYQQALQSLMHLVASAQGWRAPILQQLIGKQHRHAGLLRELRDALCGGSGRDVELSWRRLRREDLQQRQQRREPREDG